MNNKTNLKANLEKIFEAPIPNIDLPPSHYMTEDRAFREANKKVAPLLKDIQDYITNMPWSDISFDGSGETQYVILPAPLRALMSSMYNQNSEYHKPLEVYGGGTRRLNAEEKKIYNKIAHFNLSTVTVSANDPLDTNISNLYVFKDVDGTGSRHFIYMKCSRTGDRTHFPNNGINKGLKGLGQKLYRALIDKFIWVQTNSGGTGIKDLMWDSLTDYKYKSDGTRDTTGEIYSFRFGDILYALTTTTTITNLVNHGFTILNKISDKNKIATPALRKDNNIAIDPDYIAHIKAELPNMNAAIKNKALEIIDWVEPDPARAAERERLRREREAEEAEARRQREEADANARNAQIAARLQAFCGVSRIQDLDSNWQLGDWVVLKSFLIDNSDQIKVRKVVKKVGANYIALKNTDLPAFNADGTINDARNATEEARQQWVKALPPAVGTNLAPGTYGIRANAARESASTTIATPTAATTAATTINTNNIQSLFNTAADKDTTYNFDNIVRKKFLTRRIDNPYIYMTNRVPNDCKINGTPIFGYFITGESIKTLYNSKTMEDTRISPADWSAIQQEFVQYRRSPVSDKRELTSGSLVFIKQHSKFFGYIAEVLSTSLTTRGDKYVYLRVPGAGPSNRLTLTPVALDKLTRVTNESTKPYSKLFGKVFENYLDEIKLDLFDNILKELHNKELVNYVCELAKSNKINESYSELNETFFDNLKQRFDKAKEVVSNLSDKAKDALQSIITKAKDILSFIGGVKDIITNAAKDIFNNTFNKIKKSLESNKTFTDKTKELLSKDKNALVNDLKTTKDVVIFYKTKFVTALVAQIESAMKSLLGKEDLPVPTAESLIVEGENNVISKLLGNISHIPPFSWLHDVAHAGQKAADKVISVLSNMTQKLGGPAFTLPVIAVLLGIAFEINVKGLVKQGLLSFAATYAVPFIGIVINVLGVIATFLATVSIIDTIANTNIIGGNHGTAH